MRVLKSLLCAALLATAGAASAEDSAKFSVACKGSEKLRIGSEPERKVPFALTLSVDLEKKLYCYAACTREQTYPIADAAASPIMLANVSQPAQSRETTFDRKRMRLTDDQRTDAGVGTITRHATASCKPAPFVAPAQL
jgi:hypothetical protein